MSDVAKVRLAEDTHLEEGIAEVFLVVVNESDFGLELFTTLLVSEFPNMSSGFLSFSLVSGLDGHSAATECTVPTLDRDKSGVLVPDEPSDEANSRIGVFGWPRQGVDEGLFVVSLKTAVADPCAGG